MTKKEFLRHLWGKMVLLLKPRDRTRGQEEQLPQACEGGEYIPGSERGLRIASSLEFWKQGFQDLEGAGCF